MYLGMYLQAEVAEAEVVMWLMYLNGRGVLQDYKEAVRWYRLAAEQGDHRGQFNLGHMYANGYGVLQDDVYAHMWLNIAAANGNEQAKEFREIIVQEMTSAQIAEVQKLARECVAKEYKGC
mgnify:CR=1 FL=1